MAEGNFFFGKLYKLRLESQSKKIYVILATFSEALLKQQIATKFSDEEVIHKEYVDMHDKNLRSKRKIKSVEDNFEVILPSRTKRPNFDENSAEEGKRVGDVQYEQSNDESSESDENEEQTNLVKSVPKIIAIENLKSPKISVKKSKCYTTNKID